MKRIVALTLAVLMIAALFVGCSSGSVEGTYKLKTINGKAPKDYYTEALEALKEKGMEYTLEDFGLSDEALKDLMTIELKADGKFSVATRFDGEPQTATGTWTQDGSKLTLTTDGEDEAEKMEATLNGSELTLTQEDDGETVTMVLAK